MITMSQAKEILDFWFGQPDAENYGKPRKEWFSDLPEFDREIHQSFFSIYEKAAMGELDEWQNSPDGCLALIVLLDQFPRNIFRGTAEAFGTDWQALTVAQYAVAQGYDRKLLPVQRWFIYLPFEHSENIEHQRQSVQLFEQLSYDPESAGAIEYAIRHMEIIARFGRFPHRNAILGRPSTPAEEEFLKQPGMMF